MSERRMIPATTSSTLNVGSSGLVTVDGDTTTIEVVNATGVDLVSGARVLVDFIEPAGAFILGVLSNPVAWNAEPPTFTQGVALTTSTDLWRWYERDRVGRLIGSVTFNSAGTAGQRVVMTMPASASGFPVGLAHGSWRGFDSSTSTSTTGTCDSNNAADVIRLVASINTTVGTWGDVIAVTIADGDSVNLELTWALS